MTAQARLPLFAVQPFWGNRQRRIRTAARIHTASSVCRVLFLTIVLSPDVIEQHIEKGHRNRCDQLADPQGSGQIRFREIIQDTGHQVEGVAEAQHQRCDAHLLLCAVPRLSKQKKTARNRKHQIKNIKRGFSVFHCLSLLLPCRLPQNGSQRFRLVSRPARLRTRVFVRIFLKYTHSASP